MTISRREFVQGMALCAGLFAIGRFGAPGAGYAETSGVAAPALLRPPGGQDEERFLARCIRCFRCLNACPTRCIVSADIPDGLLTARTPRLDFHKGPCVFCNRCIEECPTGALAAFDPRQESIGKAQINTRTCIAYVVGTCTLCKGSCPFEALTFGEDNRPVIDAGQCNGCGQCVVACKSNVLRSYDGSRDRAVEVRRVV
jgi:ferredoxin-type protein NapG